MCCRLHLILTYDLSRALYSLIQFTTVTLLYSFASSLGDFQVGRTTYLKRLLLNTAHTYFCIQFLYIDLFIIIPIAVTSECQSCQNEKRDVNLMVLSGSNVAISSNSSQTTCGKLGVKESFVKHHWPDYHNERSTNMGVLLGPRTRVVCLQYTR